MISKNHSVFTANLCKGFRSLTVLSVSSVLLISGLSFLHPAQAETVYRNSFDDASSLDDFTVFGERFIGYNPPPLHSVSIDSGQLRIDTDYQRPNGPGTNPTLFGQAFLSADTSTAFTPGYNPILSQNTGLVTWSFNVSNQDGSFNNHFSCVLASTMAYPYKSDQEFAHGYALNGGGMVGNRMVLKRFDYGLGGGSEILIDITDGLGPLPDKGSFRITFDPASAEWSLYGETGPNYSDPASVQNLLGTAVDDTYTHSETRYFGLLSATTGTGYFDNVTVDVVPEPASVIFMVSSFLGAVFIRRRIMA